MNGGGGGIRLPQVGRFSHTCSSSGAHCLTPRLIGSGHTGVGGLRTSCRGHAERGTTQRPYIRETMHSALHL